MAQVTINIPNDKIPLICQAIDEAQRDFIDDSEKIDTSDNDAVRGYVKDYLLQSLRGFVTRNIRAAKKREAMNGVDTDIDVS